MPNRPTERAVAAAAPLARARRAAVELGPRLDAVAADIDLIRRGLRV